MKMRFYLFLILILSALNVSAQVQYIFLPESDSLSLYKYTKEGLEELGSTPFLITKLYKVQDDRFVIVNSDSSGIIFGSFGSKGYQIIIEKQFPNDFKPISISLYREFVLVGGNWSSGDFFYVFDTKNQKWSKTRIPAEIYFPGKGIDDFFVMDSTLVAVDNVVLPKYLLLYETDSIPNLSLLRTFELETNGPYETIHKASYNGEYIGLLSISGGCCSSYDNIQILKASNFEDGFSVSSETSISHSQEWNDIEIIGDKLYIASKRGLGIFRIKQKFFTNSKNSYRELNQQIGKWRIRYKLFSPKNIVQLIKLYDNNMILIYLDKSNSYKYKFN